MDVSFDLEAEIVSVNFSDTFHEAQLDLHLGHFEARCMVFILWRNEIQQSTCL